MCALPSGVAVKLPVMTLAVVIAPSTTVVQLTTAEKNETGLVPRRFAGTDGARLRERATGDGRAHNPV